MRDTLLTFLTAKVKLAGVAVAAAALSTSAVAMTTVSAEDPLEPVAVEELAGSEDTGDVEGVEIVVPEATTATDSPDGGDTDEDTGEEPVEDGDDTVDAPGEGVLADHPCPADVENHGAYVSSVAKDRSVTGRDHGKAVSAAAKSDCGKAADEAEEPVEEPVAEEPAEETVVEEPAEETVEQQSVAPARPAKPAKADKPARAEKPAKAAKAPKGGGKK